MKSINPLRERKKPGVLSQAELYSQVKDSTERNRQFFFIWIAFALYVIVTTVATTDLQLLLPNSTVTLPALGIQLPLIGFFLVTPWLVLVLHFNLLQNLDSHENKLVQWANTYPNQTPPRAALPAFLFDFALLEQGGAFPRLTQIAAQLAFYAAGPLTIGILLWRFSDYQSWEYTLSQAIAFFINFGIVVLSTMALNVKHRLKVAFSNINYWLVYVPILLVVSVQTFWVIAFAFYHGKPYLFSESYPEILLPRISILPNTSLVSFPADMPTRMTLDGEKDFTVWWKKYGVGADLKGRNLKFAQLSNVDLRGVKFYGARLQHAELLNAKLQQANMKFAHLENANFSRADVRGANFNMAKLQGVNLSNTDVDADTDFQGSELDTNSLVFIGNSYRLDLFGTTPQFMAIDFEETFVFREQLRLNNNLKLPDILNKQLFSTPTEHAFLNSTGEFVVETSVGLPVAKRVKSK